MPGSGEELKKNWERCRLDTAMKATGGLLLGGLGSILLARGRPWPVILGLGFGLGLAYINCEQDVNNALTRECPDPCDDKDKDKKKQKQ